MRNSVSNTYAHRTVIMSLSSISMQCDASIAQRRGARAIPRACLRGESRLWYGSLTHGSKTRRAHTRTAAACAHQTRITTPSHLVLIVHQAIYPYHTCYLSPTRAPAHTHHPATSHNDRARPMWLRIISGVTNKRGSRVGQFIMPYVIPTRAPSTIPNVEPVQKGP